MPKCLQILKVCKTASERLDYAFDLTAEFARRWRPDFPYDLNEVVRPNENPGTGRDYRSSGGVSNGLLEPEWPLVNGGIVEDGSLTWTAEVVSFAGLRHRIDAVVWTAPAGLVASDQVETDHPVMQEARIWISGGTKGRKYTTVGLITTNQGAEFEVRLEMTIE